MSFEQYLSDIVINEARIWTKDKLVECIRNPITKLPIDDPAMQIGSLLVEKYWKDGVGDTNRNGCDDAPWSAAFICWCLRQAKMPISDFPFSSSHQAYIRWAINNTKSNKIGKSYYGRRVGEYAPKPGDIIAQWRKEKTSDKDPDVSYDHQPDTFYASHCDIVVEVAEDRIIAIGGNVANQVKQTKFDAKDGFLVFKKEIICILECRVIGT